VSAEPDATPNDVIRSPLSVVLSIACAVAICFLPLIPEVRGVLRVGPADVAVSMGVFIVLSLAGAIAYRVWPPTSRAFERFDRAESVLVQAAVLYLVLASGRGDSLFWLFWIVHALLMGATGGKLVRFNFGVVATMSSLAVVCFAVGHRDFGGAAVAFVIAAIGLYVFWLGATIARKLATADAERARLARELADTRVHQERQRIARDIHDGLGTDLAALDWRLRSLRGAPGLEAEVDGLVERLGHGARELNAIVWALRTESRSWAELVTYLRARSGELCGDAIACEVIDSGDDVPARPGEHAIDFLRAVLELVYNAARHASPTHVRVSVSAPAGDLAAIVEDDGRGLPPEALAREEGGLRNLRDRLARTHGTFSAAPRDGGGTRIAIRFRYSAAKSM
jgi:signal transduction histidine kinase